MNYFKSEDRLTDMYGNAGKQLIVNGINVREGSGQPVYKCKLDNRKSYMIVDMWCRVSGFWWRKKDHRIQGHQKISISSKITKASIVLGLVLRCNIYFLKISVTIIS